MKPITADERLLVLARVRRDLDRLRIDAANADCGMLAYLIAMAQDEARGQQEKLESQVPDE